MDTANLRFITEYSLCEEEKVSDEEIWTGEVYASPPTPLSSSLLATEYKCALWKRRDALYCRRHFCRAAFEQFASSTYGICGGDQCVEVISMAK